MNPVVTATTWLELSEKYGLSVIIAALCIVGMVFLIRWIGKKFDQMWAVIIEVRDNVPDSTKESVEKVTRLNKAIKGVLKEAQLDFRCDWIHLWQFHNGSRIAGKNRIPFMFISLTHELTLGDVEPVQHQFIQVPMSMVDDMLFVLIDNPLLVEKASQNGYADNSITGAMFKMGVLKQDLMQVKDESGNLCAVLEMCFLVDQELCDARRNDMKEYANRISIVLATYDV